MIEKSSLNTISWLESSKCHVMWRHSISTWRHEVKELTIHILASRCNRKMILFLFFVSMVFWVTKFKYVINFSFVWCCDVMTSCHDVTKPDLPISACRCARKLILFLFPWFFRSLSSKMSLFSPFCDALTSWRHVMTSLNLIHLSQLVDVLESWFFFCFHVFFLGHWVQICHYFLIFVMRWRHDVMSWRH